MTIRSPPYRPSHRRSAGEPQLLPQAGNLRHSPCHQQGFGVVLIPHTVAHTAAEGNDVLQRRRQLHAHDVAAGVHPEVIVHEGVLHKNAPHPHPSRRPRSRWAGGPPPPRHEKGQKELLLYRYSPVSSWITWLRRRFVSRSIPETDTTTVFSVRYGAIFFAVSRTAKEGGALTTRSAPFKQPKAPVMWRDSGRWTPCKKRVLPGPGHLRRLGGAVGPEIGLVSVVAQDLAEGRAPAAGASPIQLFSSVFLPLKLGIRS